MTAAALDEAAARAWRALLALRDDSDAGRADFALTVHVLEGHAPGWCARHGVEAARGEAWAALALVPREFPGGLAWFDVQARVDALYLRAVRGMAVPDFDAEGLRRAVEAVGELSWTAGWLLGRLAARVGVEAAEPAPMEEAEELRFYRATHEVLLATEYLARAAPGVEREVVTLREGLWVGLGEQRWDLVAECVFALQAVGEPVPGEVWEALVAAQREDGRFEEAGDEGDVRLVRHTTAACLVALAGAAERCA